MFVLFPLCSQEEQLFINGKLPDFHNVDIPDIWIGLSGTLQTMFAVKQKKKNTGYFYSTVWIVQMPF